jgi:hypothetical protein
MICYFLYCSPTSSWGHEYILKYNAQVVVFPYVRDNVVSQLFRSDFPSATRLLTSLIHILKYKSLETTI